MQLVVELFVAVCLQTAQNVLTLSMEFTTAKVVQVLEVVQDAK